MTEAIREECRAFLEGRLKLTLNLDKTRITHVNDGFTFLGHRIIRKRGPRGVMRPVTTIPHDKFRNFAAKLVQELSGNYSVNEIDMVERLNRRLKGWAAFYQFTDYTATIYRKVDRLVFWKLGRKYRTSLKQLLRQWVRAPAPDQAKTWFLFGYSGSGRHCGLASARLVSSRKRQFRWQNPVTNPYIIRTDDRQTVTSHYAEVAMAMSHA